MPSDAPGRIQDTISTAEATRQLERLLEFKAAVAATVAATIKAETGEEKKTGAHLRRLLEFREASETTAKRGENGKEGEGEDTRAGGPFGSPSSLESCLEAARAENQRLWDVNAALEGLSVEAARMGAVLAPPPPLVHCPPLSSVSAAFDEHVWVRGENVPDSMLEAVAQLPNEVVRGTLAAYFHRLRINAVQWIHGAEDRDRLVLVSTTAEQVRQNLVRRCTSLHPETYKTLVLNVIQPPPGTPEGDAALQGLVAAVRQVPFSSAQKLRFKKAFENHVKRVHAISRDLNTTRQALGEVMKSQCGDSFHENAERTLLAHKHTASLRSGPERFIREYMMFAQEILAITTWVQFALITGEMSPYFPNAEIFCELVCGSG